MGKKYDVVCTIGTYEKDGQKKYISRNVGAVIETQHGLSIKLDACFNPAGCQITEEGSIWLKLFEPKENNQQPQQNNASRPQPIQTSQQPPAGFDPSFDDDLPF